MFFWLFLGYSCTKLKTHVHVLLFVAEKYFHMLWVKQQQQQKKNKKNTECFKRLRLGDKKICNLKIDQITNFVLFEKSWIIFNEKLLYILQNCVMNLKKDYFFQHHNFMKKSHSNLSKNEPENIP